MQRYFSHICDGTDVQADWKRRCTYGRASNAIDISQGSLTCPSYTDKGPPSLYGDSDTPPNFVAFYDTLGIRRTYSRLKPPASPQGQRPARPSCFYHWPKNTNLVEDVVVEIPLSCFKAEVKNISANQRPGRQFCFSDRPEEHKLGRGRWYLASCQIFVEFRSEEKSKMSQPCRG